MRGLLARVIQGGAAIVALSQAPALAADSAVLPPVSEPPAKFAPQETLVLPVAKARPLFQHSTYPAAWRAAQKSNRPILVYVSMPNCHFCEKMKTQVYQLPRVKNLVTSSFETIHIDRYAHAKLVEKLQVKWYPTTVLVGPNNKILDIIEGYAEPNQFQQRLQTGLASGNRVSELTQTR